MTSTLLRFAFLAALAVAFLEGRAKEAQAVPTISEPVMERIQRLALVLKLQDYPMTQAVFQTEIKGNPYLDLGGEAGSNVRNHEVLALTDPEAPTGYYALNVYFGEHEVGEKDVPLISDTEIVFCPNYSRRFPGAQGDVALVWMWEKHAILEILRRDMRTVGMKPSEFVRQLDETGLPSDELEAKIQAAKKTSTVKGK